MKYTIESSIIEESPSKISNSSMESSKINLENDINDLDIQYFYNLDYENKICFDCGGPFPTYVSINHGIFLCEYCANNHSKLGNNISFIHNINEPWDLYLLSYATRGGNSRFKRLCMNYEIPCQSLNENNEEKLNKYKIRLGEYYRLLLRSEILADEPPKKLYNEEAKNKCNLEIIYFPEFLNYHLYKGSITIEKKKSIKNKIWDGTKSTMGMIGAAGGIIFNVGKPVVGFIDKGIKLVGNSLWNYSFGNKKNNYNTNDSKVKIDNNNIIICGDNFDNDNDINIKDDYDFMEEDLNDIKTVKVSAKNDNNENMNKGNIVDENKYNIFTIDDNDNDNCNKKNNIEENKKNNNINENLIESWDIVEKEEDIPINNIKIISSDDINEPIKDKNENDNLKSDNDTDELNLCKEKEENCKINCLLESNSSEIEVESENTDTKKSKEDDGNLILSSQ